MSIINSNGLVSEIPLSEFFIRQVSEEVIFEGDEIFYGLEANLVNLYDLFQNKIFCDKDYYENISNRPMWLSTFGIDSDFTVSKDAFSKLISETSDPESNRVLLLHDIFFIIASIQNRVIETKELFVTFYRELCNLKQDHVIDDEEENGIYWMSGRKTIIIYSIFENLIVKIYSIFDLMTKLVYESYHKYNDYTKWPKLVSKEILYGAKNKFYDASWNDTIYDKNKAINMIINYRHEIIHNGSFEYQNKIFFEYKKKTLNEKYIYLIDYTDGNIDAVKNRKRFYSKQLKINYELPCIYFDVLKRIENTIQRLSRNFI